MSGVYQAKQPVDRFNPGGVGAQTTGTTDGSLMQLQRLTVGMLGSALTSRSVTKLVAAVGAHASMRAAADYVCDGQADEVEINAALTSLGSIGGTVLLSEGTFTIAAEITVNAKQSLVGQGMGATIVSAGAVPYNACLIGMRGDFSTVSDLMTNGNKTGNPSATAAVGVQAFAVQGALISRVRSLDSPGYGVVTDTGGTHNVVRDCVVDTCGQHGILGRAATTGPVLITGCTARGSGLTGISCTSRALVTDCQSLTSQQQGFDITGTGSDVVLQGCIAISNGAQGFRINGVSGTQLTGCRAVSNPTAGFEVSGALRTQFTGCIATSGTGGGHGFRTTGSADEVFFSGCQANDNTGSGFSHESSGRTTCVGCRGISNSASQFYAGSGVLIVRSCHVYGLSTGGVYGVLIQGGSGHVIDGCRIQNIAGSGIYINSTVSDVQITNNQISNVSLLAASTYNHITVDGDRVWIAGNMLRDPAAHPHPDYGIYIQSNAADTFVGLNDTAGAGGSGGVEVRDASPVPLTTRRLVKMQLDLTLQADTLAGALSAGLPWTPVLPNQNFRVDSKRSYIQISARGHIHTGNSGTNGVICATRLVIDSATTPIYRALGGQTSEAPAGMGNSLTGAQSVILTGLTPGIIHTVRVEVLIGVAGTAYLRASTQLDYEFLHLQVVEWAR